MINGIAYEIIKIFNVNKFIETGIKEGDTLNIVASWFSSLYGRKFITEETKHGDGVKTNYNIYEIDIDPVAIENANRIKQKVRNIITIQGDSVNTLHQLIDEESFKPSDSCFFYLDAHTAPHSEPLMREIDTIRRLNFDYVISIDDWDVVSMRDKGYSDFYSIDLIRGSIADRTDVIYETAIPNVHGKMSCFIFMGWKQAQLSPILRHLPLIETPI